MCVCVCCAQFVKQPVDSCISTAPFPAVTDVAGVVVDVGPGVKGLTAGDRSYKACGVISQVKINHTWP